MAGDGTTPKFVIIEGGLCDHTKGILLSTGIGQLRIAIERLFLDHHPVVSLGVTYDQNAGRLPPSLLQQRDRLPLASQVAACMVMMPDQVWTEHRHCTPCRRSV
ncbi:MAG: hypothetical protein Ct9H300mP11_24220 [Chloroflexota bacterium]|nr:MAG: hypothetical protein Ct9H300mP11_24220 [Chloroflexota bacterium]